MSGKWIENGWKIDGQFWKIDRTLMEPGRQTDRTLMENGWSMDGTWIGNGWKMNGTWILEWKNVMKDMQGVVGWVGPAAGCVGSAYPFQDLDTFCPAARLIHIAACKESSSNMAIVFVISQVLLPQPVYAPRPLELAVQVVHRDLAGAKPSASSAPAIGHQSVSHCWGQGPRNTQNKDIRGPPNGWQMVCGMTSQWLFWGYLPAIGSWYVLHLSWFVERGWTTAADMHAKLLETQYWPGHNDELGAP